MTPLGNMYHHVNPLMLLSVSLIKSSQTFFLTSDSVTHHNSQFNSRFNSLLDNPFKSQISPDSTYEVHHNSDHLRGKPAII